MEKIIVITGHSGADERFLECLQGLFPDCEIGAMPPFGNLYELEVYVDTALAEQPHIVFQAGSHVETIRMAYQDFATLVQPKIVDFAIRR